MEISQILAGLHKRLLQSYSQSGSINHLQGANLPSRTNVIELIWLLEEVIFPGFFESASADEHDLSILTAQRLAQLYHKLEREVRKNLSFNKKEESLGDRANNIDEASMITGDFLSRIPDIRNQLQYDLHSIYDGDPAAKVKEEVILSYPGLRAITVYRLSHYFWEKDLKLIARMMSEYIHTRTGIDIHPGAKIGHHFFIDHGTGIVIGETTHIGNNVKLYQGVTLGAKSLDKSLGDSKRHPTIEDYVTIYANATILGGKTVIGEHSIIGGNVWLTDSVPPKSQVINSPSISVVSRS